MDFQIFLVHKSLGLPSLVVSFPIPCLPCGFSPLLSPTPCLCFLVTSGRKWVITSLDTMASSLPTQGSAVTFQSLIITPMFTSQWSTGHFGSFISVVYFEFECRVVWETKGNSSSRIHACDRWFQTVLLFLVSFRSLNRHLLRSEHLSLRSRAAIYP